MDARAPITFPCALILPPPLLSNSGHKGWLRSPQTRIASGWSPRLHENQVLRSTDIFAETRSFFTRGEHSFCLYVITRCLEHSMKENQQIQLRKRVSFTRGGHIFCLSIKSLRGAHFFSHFSSPTPPPPPLWTPTPSPIGTFEIKMAALRNSVRLISTILLKYRELWAVHFSRWTLQRNVVRHFHLTSSGANCLPLAH